MFGVSCCFVAIVDIAAMSIVSDKSRNAYCFSGEAPNYQCVCWTSAVVFTHITGQIVYSSASARRTASRFWLDALNMNLIGTTYICAFKLSSHASQVGWPDLNAFDFRPNLTSNPLHELRCNVQINNISVDLVQRH